MEKKRASYVEPRSYFNDSMRKAAEEWEREHSRKVLSKWLNIELNDQPDAFINNFQSPTDIDELRDFLESSGGTNLDILLNEYKDGIEWSVHKNADIGDVVFFMCAKSSWDSRHIGGLRKEAREEGDAELIRFADEQYEKYKKIAGKIIAVGVVAALPDEVPPYYYGQRSQWFALIDHIVLLKNPVDISKFNDFIMVSRTSAITKLKPEQFAMLIGVIERENPNI